MDGNVLPSKSIVYSDFCVLTLSSALSPTKPFPQDLPRLKLAALVLPIFLGSIFTTPFIVVKGAEFGIGFGFFGDPIIQRGIELLNKKFPHWQKLLELRKCVPPVTVTDMITS